MRASLRPCILAAICCYLNLLCARALDNLPVTCGSSIKLMHANTKFRLHSHEVAYGRGSQQQSVTGFPTGDDGNSYWVIQGVMDSVCQPGTTLKKGSKLRLQHSTTRKWLHSHTFQSPLTNNQEISAYGSDLDSDGGDVWQVEWDGKNKIWTQDTKVRLKHVDTGAFLYSHDVKFGNPIAGQQEVCGMSRKDKNADWQAAEGVYLPEPGALGEGKEEL